MAITLVKVVVTAYDNYGSHWSTLTGRAAVLDAEQAVSQASSERQHVDEWHVTDPAGRPMRIVRIADPDFLDTVLAFV